MFVCKDHDQIDQQAVGYLKTFLTSFRISCLSVGWSTMQGPSPSTVKLREVPSTSLVQMALSLLAGIWCRDRTTFFLTRPHSAGAVLAAVGGLNHICQPRMFNTLSQSQNSDTGADTLTSNTRGISLG